MPIKRRACLLVKFPQIFSFQRPLFILKFFLTTISVVHMFEFLPGQHQILSLLKYVEENFF